MKYTDASMKNLDPKLKELIDSNWDKENQTFKKGLFLTGKTGVGKSYTLHAIKNAVKNLQDKRATPVLNWVEMLFELKDRMNTGNVRDYIYGEITAKDFVFIDDLGAEKQTEWSQEMLYLIINRLYERGTPFFAVTNLSFEQFSEKYGERLGSRLYEMCEMKKIEGEDRRIS